MKTAVCYYSRHHGNTLKVLEAMGPDIDLIDVTSRMAAHLEDYDCIGFASGIYYSKFHETVLDFARQYLPQDKDVFFVYTCGSMRKGYPSAIAEVAAARGSRILGEYGCRGFDTFGPFKLIGGIAKGHPNSGELEKARIFCQSLSRGR